MRAVQLDHSDTERLQRLHKLPSDEIEPPTLEIVWAANVCAVSRAMA